MSLINDALKRASTNPKPVASVASASEPAMVAVTASAPAAKPRQGTPVAMIVGMVALTAVAGWFFLKWREASSNQQAVQTSASVKPASAPAANVPTPPPATAPVKAPAAPAPVAIKPAQHTVAAAARPEQVLQPQPSSAPPPAIASTAPVAAPQPPAAPAVSLPAKPQPESMPELKLQAIVFRMKNPSALINGRHVEVGDSVSGVRIAEIQRTTVIVDWQGQKLPLQMK